jgi:hypothetical protein
MTIMEDTEAIKHIEYLKDPIKFIKENRVGVNSKTWKCENLEMMDFEETFLNHIHNNNLSITKKSRQMHMSTLTAAYCAWTLLFSENKTIAIICPKKEEANRFIENVRIILQNYSNKHFHWEDDFIKNNVTEIRLSNGSFIKAFAANTNALRGYRFDMVIMDEIAFIKKAQDIWETLTPHIGIDSKIIFYSSTNGINFFYNVWSQAIREEINFAPIDFDYTDNPDYNNKEWYETQCKILGNQDSIDVELHGLFIQNKTPESYRLNLRIKGELYEKMINKTGSSNVSDYIRKLIEKDLK